MAGADVAIADIDEQTGLKTVEGIRQLGGDCIFIKCDVASKDQVQAMVATSFERF
jgi:glucose 1-dehydrogenase